MSQRRVSVKLGEGHPGNAKTASLSFRLLGAILPRGGPRAHVPAHWPRPPHPRPAAHPSAATHALTPLPNASRTHHSLLHEQSHTLRWLIFHTDVSAQHQHLSGTHKSGAAAARTAVIEREAARGGRLVASFPLTSVHSCSGGGDGAREAERCPATSDAVRATQELPLAPRVAWPTHALCAASCPPPGRGRVCSAVEVSVRPRGRVKAVRVSL